MKAYIGIGANLGDRLENIRNAIDEIAHLQNVKSLRLSSIYETEPVQCEGEWFYNAVLEIETSLVPLLLIKHLLQIEISLGRIKLKKGYARPIDLDLLLFEDQVIEEAILTLPHPRMHQRRFVLEPLCELDRNLVHPLLSKTVNDLLHNLTDKTEVRKIIPIHSLEAKPALI